MAKQNKSPSGGEKYKNGVPQGFVDRNLVPVKSEAQFVPTPKEPVPTRYKMGGGC